MKRRLNRKGKLLLSILIATVIILIPSAAWAKDAIGSRIEIQKIDGTAYVINNKGNKIDARQGVKLSNGEALQTAAGSYIYLSLDDTKVIKIDELSQININKSGKKLKLELEEGSFFFEVKESLASDESMTIQADTMSMSIRGTAGVIGLRRINDEVVSSVELLEGRVDMTYSDVSGKDHEFTLWGGESALHVEGKKGVVRDLIDITELEGFAAKALEENPELSAKILTASGLNAAYAAAHSDELLKRDQTYNAMHYGDVFEEGSMNSVYRGGKHKALEQTPAKAKETTTEEPTKDVNQDTPSTKTPVLPTGGSGQQENLNPPGGLDTSTGDITTDNQDTGDTTENEQPSSSEEDTSTYYAVSFKAYDESGELTVIKTEKVKAGGSASAPEVPARSGYVFTGWDPSTLSNITKDTTFTALYEENPEGQYKVTFMDGYEDSGWTVWKTVYVEPNALLESPGNPSRSGLDFNGWLYDGEYVDFGMFRVTSDCTLYSKYSPTGGDEAYLVRFMVDDTIYSEQYVMSGQTPEVPSTNPTKEGFTFVGWRPDTSVDIEANTDFYAIFTENSSSGETLARLYCQGEIKDETWVTTGATLDVFTIPILSVYGQGAPQYDRYTCTINSNTSTFSSIMTLITYLESVPAEGTETTVSITGSN